MREAKMETGDWSLLRPVGEASRRNIGNRKEQQNVATMRVSREVLSGVRAPERLLYSKMGVMTTAKTIAPIMEMAMA